MKKKIFVQSFVGFVLIMVGAVSFASEAPLMPDKVVQNRVFKNSFIELGASESPANDATSSNSSGSILQAASADKPKLKKFQSGDSQVALLELFSSEGCSSCPPADQWVSTWKDSPKLWKELVPVVFHVDYWDWMGWKDRFAKPEFTERQKAYNAAGLSNSVYTPGFFLNGEEWRGWFRQKKPTPKDGRKEGNLSANVGPGRASITFLPVENRALAAAGEDFIIHVTLLGADERVQVKHGENAGQVLDHDFVVLNYQKQSASIEDGVVKWELTLPSLDSLSSTSQNGRKAIALWVTSSQAMQPLQATGAWLD